MKRYYYKFKCGIRAYQEELTVEQNCKISDIIMNAPIAALESGMDKMTFKQALEISMKERSTIDVIEVILQPCRCFGLAQHKIVFKRKLSKGWVNKLKQSEVEEVQRDFFEFNPRWTKLLTSLSIALAGEKNATKSSNGGPRQEPAARAG